jgi:hypothetical protein
MSQTDDFVYRGLRAWTAGDLDAIAVAHGEIVAMQQAASRGDASGRHSRLGEVAAEPAQRPADQRPLMPVVVYHHATAPAEPVPKPAGDRRPQCVFPVHRSLMQEMRAGKAHRDLRMASQPHQPVTRIPLTAAPALDVTVIDGIARGPVLRRARGHRLAHHHVSHPLPHLPSSIGRALLTRLSV